MRRAYPVLLSLALAMPVLTGCGGQTAETTSAFPDATSIVLSDDGEGKTGFRRRVRASAVYLPLLQEYSGGMVFLRHPADERRVPAH